jgi:hypothetical protein
MMERTALPHCPVRPAIPTVERVRVTLDDGERARLAAIARRLLAGEPALPDTSAFADVTIGSGEGPALVLEDHREINLLGEHDERAVEQRAFLLAGSGDLIALSGPRDRAFEDYYRDVLGLGAVMPVSVPKRNDGPRSLAGRCMDHEPTIERAVAAARGAGGLEVVPYLSTPSVWQLAATIAEAARVGVRVAGPAPRVAQRVNDKLWFSERIRDVLGRGAEAASYAAFTPAAAVARIAYLARRSAQVVVKVPDSAGGKGNIVLDAETIHRMDHTTLREMLVTLLGTLGRGRLYPLLVGVWDTPVVASPSVQVWVPQPGSDPVVTGVFRQVLDGPQFQFIGAHASDLPAAWQHRLAEEATKLATVFQHLGYYGPCSFDAVIAGTDLSDAGVHWVDANGRWSGVSLALNLANRLFGPHKQHAMVVKHVMAARFPARPFDAVLHTLDEHLLRPSWSVSGVVVATSGPVTRGTGVDLIAFGPDDATASEIAQRAVSLLKAGNGSVL